MPTFYDTHAHLDFPDFALDVAAVIERAAAAGITRILAVGTDLDSSRRAITLAESYPSVFAVVGWHPTEAAKAPPDLSAQLERLARHPKVAGLGETGLDYRHLPSQEAGRATDEDAGYKAQQARVFAQHLEAAAACGLNCVVHQRDAFEDVLAQMRPYAGQVRGVFHCFVNGPADMERVLALGSLVSFTGVVTFKNAPLVRQTVAATPLERLMLETDCPFLAPMPHRGRRCEPAYVREIAETVARVKGCTLEALSDATCATAATFFRGLERA
jgi:TatD DNase family protein